MLLADRPAHQLGHVGAGGDPHDRGGAARLHREPVRRKLQPGLHRLAFFAGGIVEAQREKACAGGSTGDDARLLGELAPALVHQCSSPIAPRSSSGASVPVAIPMIAAVLRGSTANPFGGSCNLGCTGLPSSPVGSWRPSVRRLAPAAAPVTMPACLRNWRRRSSINVPRRPVGSAPRRISFAPPGDRSTIALPSRLLPPARR